MFYFSLVSAWMICGCTMYGMVWYVHGSHQCSSEVQCGAWQLDAGTPHRIPSRSNPKAPIIATKQSAYHTIPYHCTVPHIHMIISGSVLGRTGYEVGQHSTQKYARCGQDGRPARICSHLKKRKEKERKGNQCYHPMGHTSGNAVYGTI